MDHPGSACHLCTFVHIASNYCSVTAKYCQIVHSEPQKSLSVQSLSILQLFNKIQEGTPQWIILLQQHTANCTTVEENFALRQKCFACYFSSVNCTGWLFIASQSNVQRQLLFKTGSSFWRLFSNSGEISVDLTAKCEVTISPHHNSHQ